jgi:hypothetical protein
MLSSSQVQLPNQICASNINTNTIINDHPTYFIFYMTSTMKDSFQFVAQHLLH